MFLKRFTTAAFVTPYEPRSLCRIDGDEMPDNMDAAADRIAAMLGDAPEAGADEPQDQAGADGAGDDGAPADEQPSAEDEPEGEPDEPAQPPIEPPLSWSKEHKERWASLPRETQEYLHSREQERDAEVRRSQNRAAELEKALEPDRAALAQQRQQLADTLNAYVALAETIDPVLAEGARTDWAKLAQDDPSGAQQRWFQFHQRREQFAAAVQQRDAIIAQHMQEHLVREGSELIKKVPEWGTDLEAARTGIDALRRGAVEHYGFQPQEVAVIRDHRLALMLRDAMAYHALQAGQAKQAAAAKTAQQTAQQKRAAAPAPRLAPSQGNSGNPRGRTDAAVLRQRGRDQTLPIDDRVDAVLAQL